LFGEWSSSAKVLVLTFLLNLLHRCMPAAAAAAFFVLAGSGWDAVSVLAREAADPQLALLVAQLISTCGTELL
jgi:hypothetical protein